MSADLRAELPGVESIAAAVTRAVSDESPCSRWDAGFRGLGSLGLDGRVQPLLDALATDFAGQAAAMHRFIGAAGSALSRVAAALRAQDAALACAAAGLSGQGPS